MFFPSLPSDSLVKFMFIGCLALLIGGFYMSFGQLSEQSQLKKDSNEILTRKEKDSLNLLKMKKYVASLSQNPLMMNEISKEQLYFSIDSVKLEIKQEIRNYNHIEDLIKNARSIGFLGNAMCLAALFCLYLMFRLWSKQDKIVQGINKFQLKIIELDYEEKLAKKNSMDSEPS